MSISHRHLTRPYAPPAPEAYVGHRAWLYPLQARGGTVRVAGRQASVEAVRGEFLLVLVGNEKRMREVHYSAVEGA